MTYVLYADALNSTPYFFISNCLFWCFLRIFMGDSGVEQVSSLLCFFLFHFELPYAFYRTALWINNRSNERRSIVRLRANERTTSIRSIDCWKNAYRYRYTYWYITSVQLVTLIGSTHVTSHDAPMASSQLSRTMPARNFYWLPAYVSSKWWRLTKIRGTYGISKAAERYDRTGTVLRNNVVPYGTINNPQ